jgi:hypothetical protein
MHRRCRHGYCSSGGAKAAGRNPAPPLHGVDGVRRETDEWGGRRKREDKKITIVPFSKLD